MQPTIAIIAFILVVTVIVIYCKRHTDKMLQEWKQACQSLQARRWEECSHLLSRCTAMGEIENHLLLAYVNIRLGRIPEAIEYLQYLERKKEDLFINGELLGELLSYLRANSTPQQPAEYYVKLITQHYDEAMRAIDVPLHTDEGIELYNQRFEQALNCTLYVCLLAWYAPMLQYIAPRLALDENGVLFDWLYSLRISTIS